MMGDIKEEYESDAEQRTKMGRRPRNDDPLPVDFIFPLTEEAVENVRVTLLPQAEDRALDKPVMKFLVSKALLPAADSLNFMGLDAPDIQIRADWMPKNQNRDHDDVEAECDARLVTQGRVQILPFFYVFSTLCRTVELSTTARRRYKHKFRGERIHILLDADQNAVCMYLSDALREALEVGWKAWMHGR